MQTQVAAHRAAGSRILVKDVNGRHEVQLALVTIGYGRGRRVMPS